MADTSGRNNGNAVDGPNYYYVAWQLASQSQAGNYSVVNWQCGWHFDGTVTDRQLDTGYADVNGGVWYVGGRVRDYVGGVSHAADWQAASGQVTITHDSDGTKSFETQGYLTGWQNATSTASAVWYTLPRIPKAPLAPAAPALDPDGNSLGVSWGQPDTMGSAITSYTVQRASNAGFTSNVVTYAGITDTATTLTGLSYGTSYYVRVKATNAAGDSPYSPGTQATTDITTPHAPDAPTVAGLTPVQAQVTWTPPSFTGGSPITSFDVQRARNAAFTTEVATTSGATSPLTLTGLLPSTTYYVRARANNAAGHGTWSAGTAFTTLPGAYVGDGSTWLDAIVWVGTGSAWVPAQVHTGDGTAWK